MLSRACASYPAQSMKKIIRWEYKDKKWGTILVWYKLMI